MSIDTAAGERWALKLGPEPGVWLGVADSQAVVTDPSTFPTVAGKVNELVPRPGYVAVKFGGDWGGMWGNPELWAQLVGAYPLGHVVPYLFCTPEHAASYREMVGDLIGLGFPAVILDCEEQWDGQESTLRSMLQTLNLQDNLIGLTGYAWFGAFGDRGAAFGKAINDLELVYLPQAYLSELTVPQPGNFMADELARVVPGLTRSYVLDSASIDAGPYLTNEAGLAVSVWHLGNLDPTAWGLTIGAAPYVAPSTSYVAPSTSSVAPEPAASQPAAEPEAVQVPEQAPSSPEAPSVPAATTEPAAVASPAAVVDAAAIDTNLGQALFYCAQVDGIAGSLKGFGLLGNITPEMEKELFTSPQNWGLELSNLMAAIEKCLHAARAAAGGE